MSDRVSWDDYFMNIARQVATRSTCDRKHVGAAIACVRGEVVATTPAPFGSHAIRFRFSAPCPTSFCEAAVCEAPEKQPTAGV